MPITLTLNAKKHNIEGNFELTFKRKRLDIKDTLIELNNGKKLVDLFPASVASSLSKQFMEKGYIDSKQSIQDNGREFIASPFNLEKERSIYSVDYLELDFCGMTKNLVVNMSRRLKNVDLPLVNADLRSFVQNNELKINDEQIYFDSLQNISGNKVYQGDSSSSDVKFIVDEGKYNAGYGDKDAGNLTSIVSDYVKSILEENITDFIINDDMSSIVVRNLGSFSNEDLLNCELSNYSVDNIVITRMPLIIDDVVVAAKYAYLYMYNKINSGAYLSSSEMNEAFENEVLSRNIFTNKIKNKMIDFTYSDIGFKKYLADYQYKDLAYKLKVMETLLDYKSDEQRLHNARTYREVTNYLVETVSPKEVKALNLVLGYAFARTPKNKIIDCIEALQEKYDLVRIIAKNDGSNQKVDDSIMVSVHNHNVEVKTNVEIGKNFHDRYIVFELKDGTSKVMLATNEIGQFFNIETSEPLGSLILIPNDEVVKNNKSLISMVKEAK